MSKRNYLFAAIRWAAVIPFIAILILFASQNKISKADFKDVSAAVTKTVDTANMQKGNDSTLKRLYGLDSSTFEAVTLYWPRSNMDAEELLLIRLKDISQQQAVKDAIAARLATQKKSFDGYGVEQYALLTESSAIDVQGNYILFVVGKDYQKADDAFRASL